MKKISVFMLAMVSFVWLGCDSSALQETAPEQFSGTWKTTTVDVAASAGEVSMHYELMLDVAEDGTFVGELKQFADDAETPGTQYWTGSIDAPRIRVLSYTPARAGGQLGSVKPLDGVISTRTIAFEGPTFDQYPGGELRFFPAR